MSAIVHPRWAVVLALAFAGRPAAAQRVLVQADGSLNVGYTQTTREAIQADPMAEAADVLPDTVGSFFTEIRPGIALQSGSPRLTWRAAYMLSGAFSPDGEDSVAYSNQANAGLAAAITRYSTLTLSAAFAQGGATFLLSQRPAEAGQPDPRAPGNPNLISATVSESLGWEAARRLQLTQSLLASVSGPQDDFGKRNTSVMGVLAIEHLWGRDSVGAELRASVSTLQPLRADQEAYMNLSNALLARWNHDFSATWNGLAMAGVEQVFTDTGSRPLAFLPTGNASLSYAVENLGAAVELAHGTNINLQVGTVSITDRITARGVITLDPFKQRVFSFSAGALHNEPLGESEALVAAGTGNALQADAGFTTAITKNMLATARYSMAYQFGQSAGLPSTLTHILFLGVTASYSNSDERKRRMPMRGVRVDRTDGEGFPVVPGDSPP